MTPALSQLTFLNKCLDDRGIEKLEWEALETISLNKYKQLLFLLFNDKHEELSRELNSIKLAGLTPSKS